MRIQPITNNITTNYYNQTKANRTPQFKGKFNGDNPKNAKIRNFFEQYMSPGCNVGHSSRYNDEGKEEYYSSYYPFNVRWTPHIELDDIPDNCEYDLNYYVTNAKAIEDDVLDMTFNFYKNYVKNYDFKRYPWGDQNKRAYERFEKLPEYLKNQYEYVQEHPERLPASYKAKLDLFSDFVDSDEYKKVYSALEKFAND